MPTALELAVRDRVWVGVKGARVSVTGHGLTGDVVGLHLRVGEGRAMKRLPKRDGVGDWGEDLTRHEAARTAQMKPTRILGAMDL